MNRFLYFAGFAFIALSGASIVRALGHRAYYDVMPGGPAPAPPPAPATASGSAGEQWFARMKPYCNPVEVEVRTRFNPPPASSEGAGFHAACFGLAGKIERARAIIEAMPARDRGAAAGVLFNVAHPVADAGDDRASGPMMELVLDYWPNNYMALYHAGMSEYSLGQTALAITHLRDFLRMYNADDSFTSSANAALAKMASASGEGMLRVRTKSEVERPVRP